MADKTPKNPDLQTFLNDPAHQDDRAFLEGVIENFLNRKAEEAARKRKEEEEQNPPNFFDRLFGR